MPVLEELGVGARKSFDENMGRFGALVSAMREDVGQSEAMFREAAAQSRIPDGNVIGGEVARQRRIAATWAPAEAILAEEVLALGAALGEIRTAFDNREMPSRMDGVIGFLSKSAVRKRQKRRFERRVNPQHLAGLLARADHLQGAVFEERGFLSDRRRVLEGLLTELAAHRPELVRSFTGQDERGQSAAGREKAATGPAPQVGGQDGKSKDTFEKDAVGVMSGLDAVAATERLVGAGLSLSRMLNAQVVALDTVSHKLQLDAEEFLILYRALAEIDGDGDRALPDDGALPNLADAVERYRNNRLVAPGEGRRRRIVDHAFVELFVQTQEEPEGEAQEGMFLSRWIRTFRPSGGR
jgi:hypothetical protein